MALMQNKCLQMSLNKLDTKIWIQSKAFSYYLPTHHKKSHFSPLLVWQFVKSINWKFQLKYNNND